PSRNEVVQVGFRLGKLSKAQVEGIDVEGEFPFAKIAEWAAAHGRKGELDALFAEVESAMGEQAQALERGGVAGELRLVNDPARNQRMHSRGYRGMLRYGAGAVQPGVDLLTAWY